MRVWLSLMFFFVGRILKERDRLTQLSIAADLERSNTSSTIVGCEYASSRMVHGNMRWPSALRGDVTDLLHPHPLLVERKTRNLPLHYLVYRINEFLTWPHHQKR